MTKRYEDHRNYYCDESFKEKVKRIGRAEDALGSVPVAMATRLDQHEETLHGSRAGAARNDEGDSFSRHCPRPARYFGSAPLRTPRS
jgi:hypothetical protein